MDIVTEGKAKVYVASGKISRDLPVFYNPDMKLNRDISLLLLRALSRKKMVVADPLAASGVRAIRFCKELPRGTIKKIHCNDYSPAAIKYLRKNVALNSCNKISVSKMDANEFLLENKPFDYIDIDPFGPPIHFLESAVRSLRKESILAVTATDTAALSGTAPKACRRKYWAQPLRNHLMHEVGLRILIRRCQLVAASNEVALTPIYSYSKLHYMRVFFIASMRVSEVDAVMKQERDVFYNKKTMLLGDRGDVKCGPLWTGQLWDRELAAKMASLSDDPFVHLLAEEAKADSLGFLDTHIIAKAKKREVVPLHKFMQRLEKKGKVVARTHLNSTGVRVA